MVLAANSKWILKLLLEFHSSLQGGHLGFYCTYQRVASDLFWFGMKKHVQQFVQAYDIFQRHKYAAAAPRGLLQLLPVPSQI